MSPRNIEQDLAPERRRLRPLRGGRGRHLSRRGDRGRRARPQDAQRRSHQDALLALPPEGDPGRLPVRRLLGSGLLQPRLLRRGRSRLPRVRFIPCLTSIRHLISNVKLQVRVRQDRPPLLEQHRGMEPGLQGGRQEEE